VSDAVQGQHVTLLFVAALGLAPLSADAGMIASSLEQYNYQTGESVFSVRSFDAFDEISDRDEFPDVTGLVVQVGDGLPEPVPFAPFYNAFKRRQSWGSVAEMVAARPIDATIMHTLQGSPAGSVAITAPGIAYADGVPLNPRFEIIGVSGFWTSEANGQGVFNFDATGPVESFSIRLNLCPTGALGSDFFCGTSVRYASGGIEQSDVQHSGLLTPGMSPASLAMTFTRGLPADGGDADPSTFGYSAGSLFALEAEFGNIFGLSDAGLGEGSQKAFVFQNNTSLLVRAVPEPSTFALLGAGALVACLAVKRRRIFDAKGIS